MQPSLTKNPTSFPRLPSNFFPASHPGPSQIEQDRVVAPTGLNQAKSASAAPGPNYGGGEAVGRAEARSPTQYSRFAHSLQLTPCLLAWNFYCELAQLPDRCRMPDVRVVVMLLLCGASENELVSHHKNIQEGTNSWNLSASRSYYAGSNRQSKKLKGWWWWRGARVYVWVFTGMGASP